MLRALELRKDFGGLTVLHPTSVDFRPGEVHALMGENGAGKSTLMKVLAGLYRPDGGHVEWRGARADFASPLDALVAGIAMIHQELMPIPDLTVAENITLGTEPCGRFGRIDRPAQLRRAKELLQELESEIDPSKLMRTLTVAQTQVVEIAKALGRQADVILMDEPTAALSDHEVAALFRAIARLKARGVAIVYTTHKMDEVFRLADRISVLRDGRLISTAPANELDPAKLISLMVGREMADVFPKRSLPTGEILLEVSGLTREPAYRDVSFQVHRGEVVALAGLMGAGRTEVVSAVYGLQPASRGVITFKGRARAHPGLGRRSEHHPDGPAHPLPRSAHRPSRRSRYGWSPSGGISRQGQPSVPTHRPAQRR
jgi:inositol transport system ATP-binding protein